jgi:hypothetical protein
METTTENSNIKHGAPAIFSFFFAGLGQFVKGHFLKAIIIWLIYAGVGGIYYVIYTNTDSIHNKIVCSMFLGIGAVIFWMWNIYDAYNSN